MWSGLLPAGVRESDDDIDEEELGATLQNEGPQAEPVTLQCGEAEYPLVESVAGPAGVSEKLWNKFQELQKRNVEIKSQANFRQRGRRRKRRRKGVADKPEESQTGVCESQPSKDDAPLEELKQFFGINDRFEPPVTNKILQKMVVHHQEFLLLQLVTPAHQPHDGVPPSLHFSLILFYFIKRDKKRMQHSSALQSTG
ncbi:protein FAM204A isoform X2 [Pleurodeles waltl]|uniref:protein FAM204A isoform X2 n=1 Tax=Pleurodeles waltl TaxID=8319 RepID=UPI0037096DBA